MARRIKDKGIINVLIKKKKSISIDVIRGLYEGMLIPTLLYGSETPTWYEYNKFRTRGGAMNCFEAYLWYKKNLLGKK